MAAFQWAIVLLVCYLVGLLDNKPVTAAPVDNSQQSQQTDMMNSTLVDMKNYVINSEHEVDAYSEGNDDDDDDDDEGGEEGDEYISSKKDQEDGNEKGSESSTNEYLENSSVPYEDKDSAKFQDTSTSNEKDADEINHEDSSEGANYAYDGNSSSERDSDNAPSLPNNSSENGHGVILESGGGLHSDSSQLSPLPLPGLEKTDDTEIHKSSEFTEAPDSEFLTGTYDNRELPLSENQMASLKKGDVSDGDAVPEDHDHNESDSIEPSNEEKPVTLHVNHEEASSSHEELSITHEHHKDYEVDYVSRDTEEDTGESHYPEEDTHASHDLKEDSTISHDHEVDTNVSHDTEQDTGESHDPEEGTHTSHDLKEDPSTAHDHEVDTNVSHDTEEDTGESHDPEEDTHASHDLKEDPTTARDHEVDTNASHDIEQDTDESHDTEQDTHASHDLKGDPTTAHDQEVDTNISHDTGESHDPEEDTHTSHDLKEDPSTAHEHEVDTNVSHDTEEDTGESHDPEGDTHASHDLEEDPTTAHDHEVDTNVSYDTEEDTGESHDPEEDTHTLHDLKENPDAAHVDESKEKDTEANEEETAEKNETIHKDLALNVSHEKATGGVLQHVNETKSYELTEDQNGEVRDETEISSTLSPSAVSAGGIDLPESDEVDYNHDDDNKEGVDGVYPAKADNSEVSEGAENSSERMSTWMEDDDDSDRSVIMENVSDTDTPDKPVLWNEESSERESDDTGNQNLNVEGSGDLEESTPKSDTEIKIQRVRPGARSFGSLSAVPPFDSIASTEETTTNSNYSDNKTGVPETTEINHKHDDVEDKGKSDATSVDIPENHDKKEDSDSERTDEASLTKPVSGYENNNILFGPQVQKDKIRVQDNDGSINEPGSQSQDSEESRSSVGSYIVLGIIMGVIVILLGYSVIKSRRRNAQEAKNEDLATEMADVKKTLLPGNEFNGSIYPKAHPEADESNAKLLGDVQYKGGNAENEETHKVEAGINENGVQNHKELGENHDSHNKQGNDFSGIECQLEPLNVSNNPFKSQSQDSSNPLPEADIPKEQGATVIQNAHDQLAKNPFHQNLYNSANGNSDGLTAVHERSQEHPSPLSSPAPCMKVVTIMDKVPVAKVPVFINKETKSVTY